MLARNARRQPRPIAAAPWGRLAIRARLAPIRAELDLIRAQRLEQDAARPQPGTIVSTAEDKNSRTRSHLQPPLAEVDAALARIDRGDYGVCLQCAGQIAVNRLLSFPSTPLCAHCHSEAA